MDAGIIAAVKKRYRRKLYERALDLMDEDDTTNLYRVDLLCAIEWMTEIWKDIESTTIHNCWCKTALVSTSQLTPEVEQPSHSYEFPGEDDCIGAISESELFNNALSAM